MKSNPPTSAITPDILSKRYTYTTLLGEGATGKTYRARDKLMGYDVAIKALRFHSNLKTHELFRREAATLKSIRLQGVPMCHDIVENPDDIDEVYIIQDFIDGESLQSLIDLCKNMPHTEDIDDPIIEECTKKQPIVPIADVLRCMRDLVTILDGLASYNPPIIHRDIKPSNILYCNNRYYLIDFGAVANPQRKSMNSTIAGTQGYMAPEQLIGDATIQSDFYGLGATVLHMITGISPVDIPTDGFERRYASVLDQYEVPSSLVELVKKLLAKSPTDRPKNAQEILDILDNTNQPNDIEAPTSLGDKIAQRINQFQFLNRHPVLKDILFIPIALFFILFYFFNTIISLWFYLNGLTQFDPKKQTVSKLRRFTIKSFSVHITWWRAFVGTAFATTGVSMLGGAFFPDDLIVFRFASLLVDIICEKPIIGILISPVLTILSLIIFTIPHIAIVLSLAYIFESFGHHQFEWLHKLNKIYNLPRFMLPLYITGDFKKASKSKGDAIPIEYAKTVVAKIRACHKQNDYLYLNYTYEFDDVSYAVWYRVLILHCENSYHSALLQHSEGIDGSSTYDDIVKTSGISLNVDTCYPSCYNVVEEQPSVFMTLLAKGMSLYKPSTQLSKPSIQFINRLLHSTHKDKAP